MTVHRLPARAKPAPVFISSATSLCEPNRAAQSAALTVKAMAEQLYRDLTAATTPQTQERARRTFASLQAHVASLGEVL